MNNRPYYGNFPKAPAIFVDALVRQFDLPGIVEAHVGRDNSLFLDIAQADEADSFVSLDKVLKIAEFVGAPDEDVFFENSVVDGGQLSVTFASTEFDFSMAFGPEREAFENLGTEPFIVEGEDEDDPFTLVTFEQNEDGVTVPRFTKVGGFDEPALPGVEDEEEAMEQLIYHLGVLEDEAQRIKREEADATGGFTPRVRPTILSDLGIVDSEEELLQRLKEVFGGEIVRK
jgi:hypothetical protein